MIVQTLLLDSTLKPVSGDLIVTITSPDGVLYQKDNLTSTDSDAHNLGFQNTTFKFPVLAERGMWKIIVSATAKTLQPFSVCKNTYYVFTLLFTCYYFAGQTWTQLGTEDVDRG